MTIRRALLTGLLRTLVQEWGHEEVQYTLVHLSDTSEVKRRDYSRNGKIQAKKKPRAIEQVARADLSPARRVLLEKIALRFDLKQFLPTNSDVRELLAMLGEPPKEFKDRSDAFRMLLKALSHFPVERLERYANSSILSGPSRLGPLSDAISAAAASLPRHREPSSS